MEKLLTTDKYNALIEGPLYFEEYASVQNYRTIEPRFLTKLHEEFKGSTILITKEAPTIEIS